MDTCSSGEELLIKTRKPYTITKQRERWTDEEHTRFLEALKQHGRAWQRIEEHIGTKTAVQIRSHAQKFFSKLEKEALLKGTIGEALDIEIPPPRPKRKPSNPYPRKNNAASPATQIKVKDGRLAPTSSSPCKLPLDLEKEPLPETNGDEGPIIMKINNDDHQAKVCPILPAGPCSSVSSASRIPSVAAESLKDRCAPREFIPSVKEVLNENDTNESLVTTELNHNLKLVKDDAKQAEHCSGTSKPSRMENCDPSQVKLSSVITGDLNCSSEIDDMQGTHHYPRHVPVHVLDGSLGTCTQFHSHAMQCKHCKFDPLGGVNGQPYLFSSAASSNTSEGLNNRDRSTIHQSLPSYPPFMTALNNQDDYQSFLNSSTTFSSLIVSTLLQNPVAHAAASFAATFWPFANIETSAISPASSQGFTPRQMGTPSMAAIAAATVAAASAWWAAHGILPFCAPLHSAFTCSLSSAAGMTSMDTGQAQAAKTCKENTIENPSFQEKLLDPEHLKAKEGQNCASKSPDISSSGSEKSGGVNQNPASQVDDHDSGTLLDEPNDSNKAKGRKQFARSSCGSNTPSSSEIETDALEKDKNGKEDSKVPEVSQAAPDSNNRRGRTSSNTSDSWKEVSEEGRLAFQALFRREVLPQSFSPPHDMKNKDHQKENVQGSENKIDNKAGEASVLDLNSKKCSPDQQGEVTSLQLMEHDLEERHLTMGLGQGKLKVRRTGFKPYKRCSVEAKENGGGHGINQSEEKCPKRICLEGEAST